MSDQLKPCPFCGSSASFGVVDKRNDEDGEHPDNGGEYVQCDNHSCAASSMLIFPTMADAKPWLIEKWNLRAPATPPCNHDWFDAPTLGECVQKCRKCGETQQRFPAGYFTKAQGVQP